MPTYTYECAKCGQTKDVFHSMSQRPALKCEACGSTRMNRLLGTGAGIIFKGSGFYETDYRKNGATESNAGGSESKGSGSESKGSGSETKGSGSETKGSGSESKSQTKSESASSSASGTGSSGGEKPGREASKGKSTTTAP